MRAVWAGAAVRLVAWKIAATGHSRLFFATGKGNPQAARFVLDGFTLADDQFTALGVENYISPQVSRGIEGRLGQWHQVQTTQ